jgi:anion-transporting  ArsA/GET3 family ATPase
MIFLNKRVHLVTGKGGVGRTSVSVALALAAAERGKRVLLTEIGDPEGGYSAVGAHFGRETLTDKPQVMAPGIDACHLWGNTGHELFGRSLIPSGPLIQSALRSRALRGFMTATPGVHELGLFYHLLRLLEEKRPDGRFRYDFVVVDMPATGHTMALATLPRAVLGLMPKGPIATAMRRGQAILNDPNQTNAWVVTLPERLPVSESLELLEGLRQTDVPVGGAILNRVSADPFEQDEREALQKYLNVTPLMGEVAFARVHKSGAEIKRLKECADGPVVTLPEVGESAGPDICQGLAQALLRGEDEA